MDELIHDLAAAYALDALDVDERTRFTEHLTDCERCRETVASFQDVGASLAAAVAGPTPRAALRDEILRAARAEARDKAVVVDGTAVAGPETGTARESTEVNELLDRIERANRRRRFRLPRLLPPALAAVAAAATVAIGLGLHAAGLSNDLDDARATLAILGSPDARQIELAAGRGRLVVRGSDAVLVLAGLERAPAGKDYQAWIVEGGTPRSAGTFEGDTQVVRIAGAVPTGAVVAVTVEDEGGSTTDKPTTTPIAASNPV